jgi:hypothetical protein
MSANNTQSFEVIVAPYCPSKATSNLYCSVLCQDMSRHFAGQLFDFFLVDVLLEPYSSNATHAVHGRVLQLRDPAARARHRYSLEPQADPRTWHSFTHSFLHFSLPSFIHALAHSSTRSFIHSLIHPLAHSSNRSFINSFFHSFINFVIHSFPFYPHLFPPNNNSFLRYLHSFFPSLLPPSLHSFIQAFIHSCMYGDVVITQLPALVTLPGRSMHRACLYTYHHNVASCLNRGIDCAHARNQSLWIKVFSQCFFVVNFSRGVTVVLSARASMRRSRYRLAASLAQSHSKNRGNITREKTRRSTQTQHTTLLRASLLT